MKIKRTPKPWALQKIFFDVIRLSSNGEEVSRRAMFLCRRCRHICEYDPESEAYRCVKCGRKLTKYGALEIIERYKEQLSMLHKQVKDKGRKRSKK